MHVHVALPFMEHAVPDDIARTRIISHVSIVCPAAWCELMSLAPRGACCILYGVQYSVAGRYIGMAANSPRREAIFLRIDRSTVTSVVLAHQLGNLHVVLVLVPHAVARVIRLGVPKCRYQKALPRCAHPPLRN